MLYFTSGGSVGLNLHRAAGRFDIRWINVATGEWSTRGTIEGGASVTIDAPSQGHWVGAITRSDN